MKTIFLSLLLSVSLASAADTSGFNTPNQIWASGFHGGNGNFGIAMQASYGYITNDFLLLNPVGSGAFLAWDSVTKVVFVTNAPAGSGTPGGNSGDNQFNEGGVFAGTNRWHYDRTNNAVTLTDVGDGSQLRLKGYGILQLGDNRDLAFGIGGALPVTNWLVKGDASSIRQGSFEPYASNKFSLGSPLATVSNLWVNDIKAKTSIEIAGSGAGNLGFGDNNGTNFWFVAPPTGSTDTVYRLPKNATTGPMVAIFEAGRTNQMTNAPLGKAQVLSYDGTNYGAGPFTVEITDTNNPNVQIDFLLPWSSYRIVGGGATNISVWLTNVWAAFPGRSISVECRTNVVTYALQVTNQAGLQNYYSPYLLTNGYPTFFKTNASHFSLVITMPDTNYPAIDAAFYRR